MGWALDMENKNTSANKVAIVTGSATGIGYETAIHLARNGFYTYATMRNTEKAENINEIASRKNLPLQSSLTLLMLYLLTRQLML